MLVAGVGARAGAAEPVEGRHAESGREISVRAAAPVLLADFEAEGRRELADSPIEREPGGALRKGRPVHASGYGQTAAWVDGPKPEDQVCHLFAVRGAHGPEVELRGPLGRDPGGAGPALNGRHVQRNSSGRVDQAMKA